MITRAVVTGGAGFIGSYLVDRLVDDGAAVLVLDDLSGGHLDRLAYARGHGEVTFHQIDIRVPEVVDLVARFRPQTVFHLAAQVSVPASFDDPVTDAAVNVGGTVNVLEAARAAGAERVLFSSSAATYGSDAALPVAEDGPRLPESPYGVSKLVAEDYLRLYAGSFGLDFASLILANVYGPRQDGRGEGAVVAAFAGALAAGRPPVIHGDGSQTRDFVFVDDVADAFVRAADTGGGLVANISSGVEVSIRELFEEMRVAARLPDLEPLAGPRRAGDASRSCLDPGRAREALGWEAWTSLEDGLADTLAWFRS